MRGALAVLLAVGCASAPPPPCPCAGPPPEAPVCPSASVASTPPPPPMACGQLALREVRLVAGGKGDKHPELITVRAQLAQCVDKRPTPGDCAAVRIAGEQLEKNYGPAHPERIMNDAEKKLCVATLPLGSIRFFAAAP